MAHTAQYHNYTRCEGNTLLRKLPEEARLSLRYYETVGLLRSFRPLPPLTSSRKVIPGKKYYFVAITDWSLYLLTNDNKVEGSVLLELPWLGIRTLVRSCRLKPQPYPTGKRNSHTGKEALIFSQTMLTHRPPVLSDSYGTRSFDHCNVI